jgi:hypothetical protein
MLLQRNATRRELEAGKAPHGQRAEETCGCVCVCVFVFVSVCVCLLLII